MALPAPEPRSAAETTTTNIETEGWAYNFQYRQNWTTWTWSPGILGDSPDVLWGWAHVANSSDWSPSSCNGFGAPRRTLQSTVPTVADIIKRFAAANGDANPGPARIVHTTRMAAQHLISGAAVDTNQQVEVVELPGHFTGYLASVPQGAALPTGNMLTLTIDPSRGEVTDWSLGGKTSNLSSLGTVSTLTF